MSQLLNTFKSTSCVLFVATGARNAIKSLSVFFFFFFYTQKRDPEQLKAASAMDLTQILSSHGEGISEKSLRYP